MRLTQHPPHRYQHDSVIPRFESLADLLRWRAKQHPGRALYVQLQDGVPQATVSYGDADRIAVAMAKRLRARAEVGDRALLLYPQTLDYPKAFLACLYAGICAVPAYPPDSGRASQSLPRIVAIMREAGVRIILTTSALREAAELARGQAPNAHEIEIVTTDELPLERRTTETWTRPSELGERLAFLQYTSGSTRTPRGVMVAHRNLADHQRYAHGVFRQPERNLTISWLPFFHDMGLIGSLLYPLYSGGTTMLMGATNFLRRPLNWLRVISDHRAQVSTAPNFAYELCLRRAKPKELEGLDLSTWRLTVCGAEPLRPETFRRFTEVFGPYGFRAETFLPCYGMADATLMVTGGRLEDAPATRHFWAGDLTLGVARACEDHGEEARAQEGQPSVELVACGKPMRAHQIRIVDPSSRRQLPQGYQGEIWLQGPSVGQGYFGRPEESRRVYEAVLADEPERGHWLRTEDTGFVFEGELYVTGRLADLVVHDGRSHQPHQIERLVEGHDPPLVHGQVALVSLEGAPVLLGEVRRTSDESQLRARAEAIARCVVEAHHGLHPRVVLIPPRSVPKTSSGKIRRHAYRKALREGSLEVLFDSARAESAGP